MIIRPVTSFRPDLTIIAMKKILILIFALLVPAILNSQYNQKLSINLSLGTFKTFGEKYTEDGGAMQFPNYLPGFAGNAGIQLKLGEHFSITGEFGLMFTTRWDYKASPDDESSLHWTVNDPVTGEVLESGENYLDFFNYAFLVKPKLYLLREKKWNPYFFTGVTINITRCWFENNLWYAMKEWGQVPPEETEPWSDILQENTGIGINPGLGLEFTPANMVHIYLETGYYYISLKEENFTDPSRVENFNAFVIQAGIRINFLKSKDL